MNQPLVSIIIVSHNQGDYIEEAVNSALLQTYKNMEIIIVDDYSGDHTVDVINKMEEQGAIFKKLLLTNATGYCKSFNLGLECSNGHYLIDLSADDVLMPQRVEYGVANLLSSKAGIDFCDAYYIDERSEIRDSHYRRNSLGNLLEAVPQGNIFSELLKRYFICTPTMMIDRQVFNRLGGYDDSLYYEDFDFWVRSSRYFRYHFTDKVLVKKRVHLKSMSKSQYLPNSKMLETTLRVCQKALKLCQTGQEIRSLSTRIRYELRQAVISNNYTVARGLHKLMNDIHPDTLEYHAWAWLINRGWDLSFLTQFMGKAR